MNHPDMFPAARQCGKSAGVRPVAGSSDPITNDQRRRRAIRQSGKTEDEDPLFIGVYPGGMVYAHRFIQEHGDYKRLGFLPWHTLALEMSADASDTMRLRIEEHAATIQAKRGEHYPISSSGQTVLLGSALPPAADGTSPPARASGDWGGDRREDGNAEAP